MGQVLHGGVTTTEAIRRAIQAHQESARAAAKRDRVSPTTVQKWRGRETSVDARIGSTEARSTVLSPEEEAIVVAFRRHNLLPFDDCLYALQPALPHLMRLSLYRRLQIYHSNQDSRHPNDRDRGRNTSNPTTKNSLDKSILFGMAMKI